MATGNAWEELLREVRDGKGLRAGAVLVCGPPGCGKRALLGSLLRRESSERDALVSIAGLGYTFLEPELEDGELAVKANVWCVEDRERAPPVLAAALPDAEALSVAVAVVVVDLARPWRLLETLQSWTEAIADHVSKVSSEKELEALKARVETYVRESGDAAPPSPGGSEPDPALSAQLPKGVLTKNVGLPLIVVGSKADVVSDASEDVETQLRLEFIQRHLREFCLAHGASLTFTSARTGKNVDTLYRYLLHRLFPAQVPLLPAGSATGPGSGKRMSLKDMICSTRDAVHVPAGWDRSELIASLANTKDESLVPWSADSPFDQVIQDPAAGRAAPRSGSLDASPEEEDALPHKEFLAKLLAKQQLLPDAGRAASTDAAAAALQSFNAAASSLKTGLSEAGAQPTAGARKEDTGEASGGAAASAAATGSGTAAPPRPVTAQDAKENPDLIANFFQNLLNRDKPGEAAGGARK